MSSPSEAQLPAIGALLNDLFQDVFRRAPSYVVPGLVWYGVSSVFSVVLVVVVLAVSYPVLLSYGVLWAWLSAVGVLSVGRLLIWFVEVPIDAAIGRGQARLVADPEATLGVGDLARGWSENLGSMYALRAVESLLFSVGLLLFVIPGLLVKFALGFAGTAVIVDGCGPVEAMKRSFAHTRAHLTWDIGFFAMEVFLALGGSVVPVLGPILGSPMLWSWQIRGYRASFPEEGQAPVIEV